MKFFYDLAVSEVVVPPAAFAADRRTVIVRIRVLTAATRAFERRSGELRSRGVGYGGHGLPFAREDADEPARAGLQHCRSGGAPTSLRIGYRDTVDFDGALGDQTLCSAFALGKTRG